MPRPAMVSPHCSERAKARLLISSRPLSSTVSRYALVIFLLTEFEAQAALEALQAGVRRADGLIQVDLAMGHHHAHHEASDSPSSLPALTFLPDFRTVHCGTHSARLSPTQFKLFQYVYTHRRASFEDVQDAVWGEEVSDDVIRKAASRLSSSLLENGVGISIETKRNFVCLEMLGDLGEANVMHLAISKKRDSVEDRFVASIRNSRAAAKRGGYAPCTATKEEIEAAFTGNCSVCGLPERKNLGKLHMDHNHATGEFRGWLCRACNVKDVLKNL